MEHRAAGFPFGLLRSLTNCSRSRKERESSKKVEQLIHIWTKAAKEQEIESFPAVACIVCVRLFKGNKASYSGTRYRSRELSGFSQVHLFILSVGQCIELSEKEYGGKRVEMGPLPLSRSEHLQTLGLDLLTIKSDAPLCEKYVCFLPSPPRSPHFLLYCHSDFTFLFCSVPFLLIASIGT